MAEYKYTGPHPVTDEQGEIVRPGDRREYAEPPPWGPWRLPVEPGTEPPPAPQPKEPAARKRQPDAGPPASPSTAPPAKPEGT